jgi:POT family proton-dependent oligopeptide transporter
VLLVGKTVTSPAVSKAIESTGFHVTAFQMFFFAGFAFVAAAAFAWLAGRFKPADYYRAAK